MDDPLQGLLYTARLFKRIVIVATGSGKGSFLFLLQPNITPHLILGRPHIRKQPLEPTSWTQFWRPIPTPLYGTLEHLDVPTWFPSPINWFWGVPPRQCSSQANAEGRSYTIWKQEVFRHTVLFSILNTLRLVVLLSVNLYCVDFSNIHSLIPSLGEYF